MPRASTEVPGPAWFKSSYSGGNETECVEAAFVGNSTAIRDSKWPQGHHVLVHSAVWSGFVGAVRDGQLS
ncbi:DUF397 domain-containing protein [Streptomyces sp. NPDC032198]|uniref:DUF397 domain-containing protein n=1 Tax=Streptomyces sp. NPDC032198 TaxID=3155127 RepID=UPI0033C3F0AD